MASPWMLLVVLAPLFVVLALWVGALYDKRYANVMYKLHLLRMGIGNMVLSTDKRFPKRAPKPDGLSVEETKTIIFVRHAESAWNLVFNKGINATLPTRFAAALKNEVVLLPTLDSVFFDSPLSPEGAEQAETLQTFLEKSETMKELEKALTTSSSSSSKSLLVASNLRRALSTATIGFFERLKRTGEKISILSCLQEVTFNIDGISLAKPFDSPQLSLTELNAIGLDKKVDFNPKQFFETNNNFGDKEIFSHGFERLLSFCEFCFDKEQEEFDTIIATGHSLYFRYFFRYFLDANENHIAKKSKIANCGVVKFELQKGTKNGEKWFRIPDESLEVIHIGFETQEKKKEKKVKEE